MFILSCLQDCLHKILSTARVRKVYSLTYFWGGGKDLETREDMVEFPSH